MVEWKQDSGKKSVLDHILTLLESEPIQQLLRKLESALTCLTSGELFNIILSKRVGLPYMYIYGYRDSNLTIPGKLS